MYDCKDGIGCLIEQIAAGKQARILCPSSTKLMDKSNRAADLPDQGAL
jgi:hypothetical protein